MAKSTFFIKFINNNGIYYILIFTYKLCTAIRIHVCLVLHQILSILLDPPYKPVCWYTYILAKEQLLSICNHANYYIINNSNLQVNYTTIKDGLTL